MPAKSLVNLMARRSGHFHFESGHHGDRWLEPDLLLQRPTALRPFAIALSQRLGRHRFEVVCGPLTGGAFLAQMVAEQCDVGFAFAERFAPPRSDALYQVRYRIPTALRDGLRGATVAIVNDVTNAGSAVLGTYQDLISCGARPVALGTLIALGSWSTSFADEHDLALEALERLGNNLWTPEECPLCAGGEPLEDLST
ncbi:MAG TPA: orotate phosphoribosyltransferase [Candidatus Dormibacteraeota bacterium]|nr:orotate phosphoribosyltransferase [Candidatus Dormibacteraeota bacterium]